MKFIPQDFIFDLVARTNIVDVIGQRVPLKKKGHNYFGNCPFHNEKTPSFSVNDKKQIFYCFGCGATGSVIGFLMDFDRLSYVEAIEELANMHGLTVPYVDKTSGQPASSAQLSANNQRADLYALMAEIAHFYHQQLLSSTGQLAQDYLARRGLNSAVIERFNIGYAPDGWNETNQALVKDKARRERYEQAGMLVTNDNRNQYDRFRGRAMFPIRDTRGNIIGFGGRTLKADDNVKYLNSPETVIFHKGRHLYGLYEALQQHRDPKQLLVVEGYMDVVALAQFDITYAVAALGTATTEEHIKLLFRHTEQVVFCYDGDEAGRRAAWRALNTLLPILIDGKQIKFVFLPQDEDPDSLVRTIGKQQFEQTLNQGLSLLQFFFDHLLKQVDLKTPEGRTKLSSIAIPLINQIRAETYAIYLKQELGKYLGILDALQLDKLFSQSQTEAPSHNYYANPVKIKLTTMRILIGLLLQYPELAKRVPDTTAITASKLPGIDIFIKLLAICHNYPNINTAQLLSECIDTPFIKTLKLLATWEHKYSEDQIETNFSNTLKELYDSILAQRQDELLAKSRTEGLVTAEKKELLVIQQALKGQS